MMKTRGVVLLAYALRTAAADDRATHELTVAGERRLALPIVNSSGAMNLMGQGRMEYTYLSPRPFNFREHDNPWTLLCGDIEIYDLSSSDLTAAFLHFDPATWKDDALRYPGTVPEVHGSYDERSRTMTLEATGGELCGNQNFTARSCCIVARTSTPSTRRLLAPVALVDFHTGRQVRQKGQVRQVEMWWGLCDRLGKKRLCEVAKVLQ